jgi:hypothetical protein
MEPVLAARLIVNNGALRVPIGARRRFVANEMGFTPVVLPVVRIDTFVPVVIWVDKRTPLGLVMKHVEVCIAFELAN